MVKVGEVFWVARVEGQGKASAAAQDLQDDMGDVAEQSTKAAAAQETVASTTGDAADSQDDAAGSTGVLTTAYSLLGSGLLFAANRTGLMTVATLAYSKAAGVAAAATTAWNIAQGGVGGLLKKLGGLLGTASAYLSGFVSWLLAGSAGAFAVAGAIGAAIGLLGVWILEVTGALDAIKGFGEWVGNQLPGFVRDGLLNVLSIVVGPLAVLGGLIVGFVEDGFSGAFDRAGQIVDIFIGSWARNIGRLGAIFDKGIQAVISGFNQFVTIARNGFNSFFNWVLGGWNLVTNRLGGLFNGLITGFLNGFRRIQAIGTSAFNGFKEAATGAVEDIESFFTGIPDKIASVPGEINSIFSDLGEGLSNKFAQLWNAMIPAEVGLEPVTLPTVTIDAGPLGSADVGGQTIFGGVTFDLPQLQAGGLIEDPGIAEVHRGEAVLPEPITSALQSGSGMVGQSAESRASAVGGTGGGGGGETTVENNYDITLGDQSLDLSNLDRRTLKTLARLVGDELGDDTGNITGA